MLSARHSQVVDTSGKAVPNLYCIGDANGKYMLAHAASAQGIAAVECMCGRDRVVNHMAVPAACFTHPEVSFVGMTEDAAREKAEKEGWADKLGVSKTYYKVGGLCVGGWVGGWEWVCGGVGGGGGARGMALLMQWEEGLLGAGGHGEKAHLEAYCLPCLAGTLLSPQAEPLNLPHLPPPGCRPTARAWLSWRATAWPR